MDLLVIASFFGFLFWGSLAIPVYIGDLPLENPDLLGGDIIGVSDFDRSATIHPQQLWPNGVIPYVEDPGLKKTVFSSTLWAARTHIEKTTCIRFKERTDEKDYLRIFPGQGCYSHVGRTGGAQPLSLGQGCGWHGTVVHEFIHAIGFYHEQNRSDRDDYLVIYWDNIKEGTDFFFF
ncbi:astacin-like metalloprotease toxin 5 [Parasteatoda tepidariorum]|uniref:astacin-like metalloprotease toxin 5 n=1 Tax=Parasteatoda tepidariorum TaxID=114398 RepID=UPI001C721E35|nr:astacin-like metalloprotease toxin 5 [Parasteatoda tepidariorum]